MTHSPNCVKERNMIHKEFWGILFLIFVGWIFIPGHPTTRIEHACRPIGWGGNVVTSLTSLVLPAQQSTTQNWFDKFEYGCQYTVWRLIYQDEYNKHLAAQTGKSAGKKPEVSQESAEGASAPAGSGSKPPAPPAPPSPKDGK
jgi:hypothetical protein